MGTRSAKAASVATPVVSRVESKVERLQRELAEARTALIESDRKKVVTLEEDFAKAGKTLENAANRYDMLDEQLTAARARIAEADGVNTDPTPESE